MKYRASSGAEAFLFIRQLIWNDLKFRQCKCLHRNSKLKISLGSNLEINFVLMAHNDHRAGAGVDIVREYEVRLGSLQIQMKFYLEKMKLR